MTEEIIEDEIEDIDSDAEDTESIEETLEGNQPNTLDDSDEEGLSEDELDEIADVAIDTLQNILSYFNIGDITIDEYEGDEGELILDITGDDLAILIGRHGRTLDSLQYIVSQITHRKINKRYPLVIDVEGYRTRQREKLETIAISSANRAVKQHRNISLRPMTPYERRIIHIALKDDVRVETESEGVGTNRHVVIFVN